MRKERTLQDHQECSHSVPMRLVEPYRQNISKTTTIVSFETVWAESNQRCQCGKSCSRQHFPYDLQPISFRFS
jgi:hypothetical protein